MSTRKTEILETSRALINAGGLAGLSVRGVAEQLGLSPGNVSYHFPRKENLVLGLVQQLRAANDGRLDRRVESVSELLELMRALFVGQLEFRGLHLALPDIVATYPDLRSRYAETEAVRRARLRALLEDLRDRGALEATDEELARVGSHLAFVGRFWVSESRLSYARFGEARVIAHYLSLLADVLRQYVPTGDEPALAAYLDAHIDLT